MIRMIQSVNATHAKSYYSDALQKSDYYLSDVEVGGSYRGLLAGRLGLSGPVTREGFFALIENIDPVTGKQLTQRTIEQRTTGYDINFHCPKSVSVLHILSHDDHIAEAFRAAVFETMADIEADAMARVRIGSAHEDRHTGELLWTDFLHQTARPVGGHLPDPHLHMHCYVFNATHDPVENKIKAGQFRYIKRDMPFYQSRYLKRLSDKLIDLGYEVRRTKNSFEVEGVPKSIVRYFSKRSNEIGRVAREKGITDAKALDELGARTRSAKIKEQSMGELKTGWLEEIRLTGVPEDSSQPVRYGPIKEPMVATVERSLDFSLQHHFEKASVMPERRLLATAYSLSIGDRSASMDQVDAKLQSDPSIISMEENGQKLCTVKSVLAEEQYMVGLAMAGHGRMAPLYAKAPDIQATGQQGRAIAFLLTTTDQVSIVRGAAGAGKTTLMQEAVPWMQKAGKEVTVVAPTTGASRDVLRADGFSAADTVASLLLDKKRQDKLQDGVLWVDEAPMLGTREMTALLELAKEKNARLILGGDTRQHSSVDRGDAVRVLCKYGQVQVAEVSKIYRQKNEDYRLAVQALSEGDIKKGFERLDQMGALVPVDALNPNTQLVDDYMASVKQHKKVLVIAPSNVRRQQLSGDIRKRLQVEGRIGKKELQAERLSNLYLSQAEKDDWQTYQPGQVVQFTQNTTGIRRGSRWNVHSASEKEVLLADPGTGRKVSLPQGRTQCFDVLERSTIPIAKGDQVRVTRTGFDQDKKGLDNGQVFEVLSVHKNGRIALQNMVSRQQYHIDDRFGHIDHAYCMTSYASQGKTVQEVLIAQSADTFPATNAKQFYVSVSRARESIRIYTDDKEQLLDYAQRSGDRTAAMELVGLKAHEAQVQHLERDVALGRDITPQPQKEIKYPTPDYDHYEPGL